MATEDARKLFVAGLPDSVTEDALREIFEAVGGTVVDVSLPRDRATGRPRGFGFVTFSTSEEAGNARNALDGSLQAGRSISVRPFSSEPPRRGEGRPEGGGPPAPSEDRTLYVGNLPYDISQQEVADLLGQNGVTQIVRVHLPAGPDGRPRGFGFVTLGSAEAANEAIIQLRGVEVRGRRLMVNIAHPRGERPAGAAGLRPPRTDAGFAASSGSGEPRFPSPDAAPGDPSRAVDPRRARNFGPPAPPGGSGGDWADKKKKKGRKGGGGEGAAGGRRERGGGGRHWDSDPDDE